MSVLVTVTEPVPHRASLNSLYGISLNATEFFVVMDKSTGMVLSLNSLYGISLNATRSTVSSPPARQRP